MYAALSQLLYHQQHGILFEFLVGVGLKRAC